MPNEVADDDTGITPEGRWDALVETLRDIAAAYDGSPGDDSVRRKAGCQQLMAIVSYFQGADVRSDTLRPVTAVIHGLIDLEHGGKPSLFQAQRKRGGLDTPRDELRQRGLAAALLTLFLEVDKAAGLDVAARKTARRIAKWRCARLWRGGKQPLAEAVKDWRERARKGGDDDAVIYAQIMEIARNDQEGPAHVADWILTAAYRLYR